jgi:hypothetical protein
MELGAQVNNRGYLIPAKEADERPAMYNFSIL